MSLILSAEDDFEGRYRLKTLTELLESLRDTEHPFNEWVILPLPDKLPEELALEIYVSGYIPPCRKTVASNKKRGFHITNLYLSGPEVDFEPIDFVALERNTSGTFRKLHGKGALRNLVSFLKTELPKFRFDYMRFGGINNLCLPDILLRYGFYKDISGDLSFLFDFDNSELMVRSSSNGHL